MPSGDPLVVLPDARESSQKAMINIVRNERYDGIIVALGALGLVALAYFVAPILSPFVIMIGLYVVLSPFRQYHAVRNILWSAGFLFALWFFSTLSGLLIPFILGAVLAYLFNPLVTKLHERYRIPRAASSGAIILLVFGLLTLLGFLFLPTLAGQLQAFVRRITQFVTRNASKFDSKHLKIMLLNLGLPPSMVDQIVVGEIGPEINRILSGLPVILIAMLKDLPKIIERTFNMIIVPISAFYFLKDWQKMGVWLMEIIPTKDPGRRAQVVGDIDRVLYTYIRGQATVAAIVGVLAAIAYSILGIPYAGLLGVLLAVADLIPIAGMIFSAIVVELVIILTMEITAGVLLSGILVIVALHALEVYIISPRLIGQGIGIPPVIMILSLLVFGYFLGFVGILIAVPATAVIILFLEEHRKNQKETV